MHYPILPANSVITTLQLTDTKGFSSSWPLSSIVHLIAAICKLFNMMHVPLYFLITASSAWWLLILIWYQDICNHHDDVSHSVLIRDLTNIMVSIFLIHSKSSQQIILFYDPHSSKDNRPFTSQPSEHRPFGGFTTLKNYTRFFVFAVSPNNLFNKD